MINAITGQAAADVVSLATACGGLPVQAPAETAFQSPWEAKAFALVVSLSEAGYFSWSEWVACFSRHVARAEQAQARGELAKTYFEQWVDAAEELLVARRLTSHEQLLARRLSALVPPGTHVVRR